MFDSVGLEMGIGIHKSRSRFWSVGRLEQVEWLVAYVPFSTGDPGVVSCAHCPAMGICE